ncbi:MAG TPA: hypothetical protein VFN21_02470 [Acidimicrobiales bacterium]|nr:hypothetical protein [Acidimicrobiales bacterium]
MRTTVTLDPDVEHQLRERMRERGTGFKETINEILRRGLHAETPTPARYEVPVFDAEIRPGVDLDKALALAAAMEDDEILRKLSVGK